MNAEVYGRRNIGANLIRSYREVNQFCLRQLRRLRLVWSYCSIGETTDDKLGNVARASIIFIVGVLVIILGLPVISLLLIVVSAFGGYFMCSAIIFQPILRRNIENFLSKWILSFQFFQLPKIDTKNSNPLQNFNTKSKKGRSYYVRPWESLYIPRQINDALEKLCETFVENYVANWYNAKISLDKAFLFEIRHQIRHCASVIYAKANDNDFILLIVKNLMHLIVIHSDRIYHALKNINEKSQKELSTTVLESKIIEQFSDLHWTMLSSDNELEYLRLLSDLIVETCVDASHIDGKDSGAQFFFNFSNSTTPNFSFWPSQCCRHFLRESVLFNILIPTINFLAEPHTFNRALLSFLTTNEEEDESWKEEEEVEFLNQFTKLSQSHAPDSLLCLNLNELVRQPRLVQLFDMYLKTINGPTHFLDCFMQARDIYKRLQNLKLDSDEYEGELSEIESDAWQLYSSFIHTSACNKIVFSHNLSIEFESAINFKDLQLLEKAIEDLYKEVYQKLHYDYVIPFCQSESYMGYLCGAPPVVEELIRRGPPDENLDVAGLQSEKRANSNASFSLSQFRNKLFSLISNKPVNFSANNELVINSKSSNFSSNIQLKSLSTEVFGIDDQNNFYLDPDYDVGEIPLIDLNRDLNKWDVSIIEVEARHELISSKINFVYVIDIRRNDLAAVELDDKFCKTYQSSTHTNNKNTSSSISETLCQNKEEPFFLQDSNVEFEKEILKEFDAKTDVLLTHWTTSRKYDDFFSLETKIREIHGNSMRLGILPDRKTFLTAQNRSLMEAHKPLLERFLQTLVKQSKLKRSNLLYNFLTLSEDEWIDEPRINNSSFMPDLRNSFRAMRQMPTKLVRERGQNLKPFVLNMLANILFPRTAIYSCNLQSTELNSLSSLSANENNSDSSTPILPTLQKNTLFQSSSNENIILPTKMSASIFCTRCKEEQLLAAQLSAPKNQCSNIFLKEKRESLFPEDDDDAKNEKVNVLLATETNKLPFIKTMGKTTDNLTNQHVCGLKTTENFLLTLEHYFQSVGSFGVFTFVLLRIIKISTCFEALFVGIYSLFSSLINEIIYRYFCRRLNIERIRKQTILKIIQSLQTIILPQAKENEGPTATDEEKRLCADLAFHRLNETIQSQIPTILTQFFAFSGNQAGNKENLRHILNRLFTVFQLPRLNKQLLFVLIDTLVQDLCASKAQSD